MNKKKLIRARFRDAVFGRDEYRCKMCSNNNCNRDELDSHHICDRTLIINGGYVLANGITLCSECHIKAEQFHDTGVAFPGYSPEDLYDTIGSSYKVAIKASERLDDE